MRIEQLEYVAAVFSDGSLRRASERLHISQPALSEAISKLERELGVTLLDRHREGARISRAGRELLQPLADVLQSVDRLKAAAGDYVATRHPLRIGTVHSATASLLLPALRSFVTQHSEANVEIRSMQQDEIYRDVTQGLLDLGLVNLLDGDDVPPEIASTVLLHGRPVAVVPTSHPFAGASAVSVDDLRGEPFVAMRVGYVMHRFAHRLFGSVLPAEWHSTDGAEMGKLMVVAGIGLTILPDYSVVGDPLERAGLIVGRPISGEATTFRSVALHRRQARVPGFIGDLLLDLRARAQASSQS